MALNKINVGTAPNEGNGDTLRDAFIKVNENYDNIYDKSEVDTKIAGVEVDLSNYDTKAQVDTKITSALDSLTIPTKTSELENDGDGVSPFVTVAGLPTPSLTIDQVLANGNSTNRALNFGTSPANYLKIDPTNFNFMEMVNPLDSSGFALRISKGGLIQTSAEVRVKAPGEGSVSLGSPSIGALTIYNTAGTRYTRIMAVQPTANNTATLPNKSGTIAMTSDIPSMSNFVPEAPIDNKQYGRRDGVWTEIITSAPDPGTQNLQLVGTSGYKILTATANGISSYGTNALFFGNKTTAASATLGDRSVSFGMNSYSAGSDSMVGGNGSNTTSSLKRNSIAWGQIASVNHSQAFAFGNNVNSTIDNGMVVGIYNRATGTAINSLFTVGNGTSNVGRTNALEVLTTGLVLAPDCSVSEIDAESTGSVLVTKQWVETKVTMPSIAQVSTSSGMRRTNVASSNYYNIGNYAADFTVPTSTASVSSQNGVSGHYSIGAGIQMIVSGAYSAGFGSSNIIKSNTGDYSIIAGENNLVNGRNSAVFGSNNISDTYGSFVTGRYATGDADSTDGLSWVNGASIFRIGNGTDAGNRHNAYELFNDGTSIQSGIASYEDDYSVAYTDRSLVDKGYVLNPTTFLAMLDNATPTQVDEIKNKLGLA